MQALVFINQTKVQDEEYEPEVKEEPSDHLNTYRRQRCKGAQKLRMNWYRFPSKVLHFTKRKAYSSTVTELKKLVNEKVIRSSKFLKKKFNPNGELLKLKSGLVAGVDRQNRALYGDGPILTAQ